MGYKNSVKGAGKARLTDFANMVMVGTRFQYRPVHIKLIGKYLEISGNMGQLDKESKRFIKWADDKLSDKLFVQLLATKAIYKFIKFVNGVPIRQRIHDKLVVGGYEHGEPIYTKKQANKELEAEFIDLFGWQLVELWQKVRKNERNTY